MDARQAIHEQSRTIAGLARKVGVSRGHLSHQLAGGRPMSPEQAQRLADLTGLPVALFLCAYQRPERQPAEVA